MENKEIYVSAMGRKQHHINDHVCSVCMLDLHGNRDYISTAVQRMMSGMQVTISCSPTAAISDFTCIHRAEKRCA